MNGQNRRRRLLPDKYDREQYAADPWKNLALAIVQQALTDYLTALKAGNGGSITALERFFRSDWYDLLSDVDGELVIKRARSIAGKPKKQC